ncbi:hypothetical protein [Streptosporangium sp. CA-115845]|uniref:hypothetical protein n=1 Tax=Streptosporangium sp. CA-115845 TaxID=3240071 RepID=UPI003D9370AE
MEELLGHVRGYGRRDVETGGLLITRPREAGVAVLALAGSAGIQRQRGLFVITMPALDAIFTYAEDRDLQVRAMFHSHKHRAFMSSTDRRSGLNAQGFISTIIPTYTDPPPDPSQWGWWRYEKDWHPTSPAVADQALSSTKIITFDAGGVLEH